jgi:photosystem II stability/assembly factor-like uncharacterized protein
MTVLLVLASGLQAQWTELSSGSSEVLWGCATLLNQTAYAVGNNGTILRTDNNGGDWYTETSPYLGVLNAICRFDAKFICGDDGTILRKVSGDWTECTSNTTVPLYGIQSTWGGIAVGHDGIIRKTTSGITWTPVTSPTSRTLYGLSYGVNSLYVVAVGSNGTIVRCTDGGTTWTLVSSVPTTQTLFGVAQMPAPYNDIVIACGNLGTILRSTNRGATWSSVSSGTGTQLLSVCFGGGRVVGNPPRPTVTVVGTQATILESTDWGQTWNADACPVSSQLCWADAYNGGTSTFVVGVDGTILRRDPLGGVEERGKATHGEPWLRVSPDPSSGPVRVAFAIPSDGNVLVTVSDVTGKAVRRLLDCRTTAGNHVLSWDGTDDNGRPLPKGIYICELRAHGLAVTQKLVMVER